MAYSNLYSAICRGKWFISFSEVDANLLLVHRLLAHDASLTNGKNLSEDTPIPFMTEAGGRLMKHSNRFADAPKDSTAVIPLHGTMLKYGTYCSYGTTEVAAIVEEATQAKNISSILLDIDSGGGSVDAIAPLIDAIHSAQSKRKAVVAYCDLCASAAYYVGQLLQRDCGRQRGVRRTGQHRGDDELHGLREVLRGQGHQAAHHLFEPVGLQERAVRGSEERRLQGHPRRGTGSAGKGFPRKREAQPGGNACSSTPRACSEAGCSTPGKPSGLDWPTASARWSMPPTGAANCRHKCISTIIFTLNLNELCLQK